MTILASLVLASMTQIPLASAPAATAPATTDLRPLPAQADAGAPEQGTFTIESDLRDPFAHVPRGAPPRPTAPPHDLKDPFSVQRAPSSAAPPAAVDPAFIDPFVRRDDRVEASAQVPSALKDPFAPAPRPAAPSALAPGPRPPPIQRPTQRPTLAPRRV